MTIQEKYSRSKDFVSMIQKKSMNVLGRYGVYVCRVPGCWLLLSVMMLLTLVCVIVVLSVAVGGILFIVVAACVLLVSVGGAVSVISAKLL